MADAGVDRPIKSGPVAPPTPARNNRQEKETEMSTRKTLTLASMIAMLLSPAAFSADRASDFMDNSFQVLGESLDSGLGDLSPSYTAAEFQRYRVAGESLDSGLGYLPPSYTAAEFQKKQIVAAR